MRAARQFAEPAPIRTGRNPLMLVTPIMLEAGRKAFLAERETLDDLWECFDEDRDQFLTKIFCAMAGAAS